MLGVCLLCLCVGSPRFLFLPVRYGYLGAAAQSIAQQSTSFMATAVAASTTGTASTTGHILVPAPAGDLGLRLCNTLSGPTVDALLPDSPLQLDVGIGWKLLAINGESVTKAEAAVLLLDEKRLDPIRQLTFLDPERRLAQLSGSVGHDIPTGGTVYVDAPPGRLGLLLGWEHGSGGTTFAIVTGVRNASPLVNRVHVGWRLLQLDGVDVSQMQSEQVVKLLGEAAGRSRTLMFEIPPQNQRWDLSTTAGRKHALKHVAIALLVATVVAILLRVLLQLVEPEIEPMAWVRGAVDQTKGRIRVKMLRQGDGEIHAERSERQQLWQQHQQEQVMKRVMTRKAWARP